MEQLNNKLKCRVFVPPSFEGVMAIAILEEIINEDVELEVQYTNSLDFRDYHLFKDADVVVTLGHPYRGYTLPEDFYLTVEAPFLDFIHISTYGQAIKERENGSFIISMVSEETDPVKELYNILRWHPDSTVLAKHMTLTDKAFYLVEAVNAYRTWTWETNDTTRVMLALYNASYKMLPRLIKGLELKDIVCNYAPIIKGQLEKAKDFIERKRGATKKFEVTIDGVPCILKVVYAEAYINELANDLLLREVTPKPVIVCVGRATKSNDIFSIRTKGVNAARVAQLINEGAGKENVATVFSTVGFAQLMGNTISKQLRLYN